MHLFSYTPIQSKVFHPRSSNRSGILIDRVNVAPRGTLLGGDEWHFDNPIGSHHQSQVKIWDRCQYLSNSAPTPPLTLSFDGCWVRGRVSAKLILTLIRNFLSAECKKEYWETEEILFSSSRIKCFCLWQMDRWRTTNSKWIRYLFKKR